MEINDHDLAGIYAEEIQKVYQDKMDALVLEIELEEPESEKTEKKYLFQKMRFQWRKEDKFVIDQIHKVASITVEEIFDEYNRSLDHFYSKIRIPVVDEDTGEIQVSRSGKTVWERDENGIIREDSDLLTSAEIDTTLLSLTRLKAKVDQVVNTLFSEAVFARYTYDDKFHEDYEAPLKGTIEDRNAKANRETIEQKYFAFFRYVVWSKSNEAKKDLESFIRMLEKIRGWRTWTK